MKLFFFGEFGWYNLFIIPLLQRLQLENQNINFELVTFPDYKEIIELLFPSIRVKSIEFISTNERSQQSNFYIDKIFLENGYFNLFDYLETKYPRNADENWAPELKYPLIINDSLLGFRNKIGIFPRYRKDHWLNDKKFFTAEFWKKLINYLEKSGYEVVIFGNSKETLELDETYKRVTGMTEAITYLNNIKCLISPDSGFCNLGVLSNCENVIIISNDVVEMNYFINYKCTRTNIININNIDNNIQPIIDNFLLTPLNIKK